MKVLVTCSWYFPQFIGGAETFAREICNILSRDHDVTVYCRNALEGEMVEFVDGVKVIRQKYAPTGIRLFRRISEYCQDVRNGKRIKGDYDLTISTSFGYSRAVKIIYPELKSIFLIAALVNTLVDRHEPDIGREESLRRRIDYHLFRYMERKAFVTANRLIAPSRSLYKHLMREYKMDYSKIKVVPMGIDPKLFSVRRDKSVLAKWNIQTEKFIILAVARLVKLKNIPLLIKSMQYVNKDAVCVIVGDGRERSSLQDLVKKMDLQDRVFFAGEQINVRDYYAAADILVHPSVKESFGMVLLEAMVSGLPSIGLKADISAGIIVPNEEIITGDIGFCIENDEKALAKAINALKDDSALRQAMSESARRRALEKYSLEDTVREVIS